MFKDLLELNIRECLKLKIEQLKDSYLDSLEFEEDRQMFKMIIEKYKYTRDDINDLLINHFSYVLDDFSLYCLIKENSNFRKKLKSDENILIYIILMFLVDNREYLDGILSDFYNVNIDDITIIDNYLTDATYSNNLEVISVINRLENSNIPVKKELGKLKKIIEMTSNGLLDLNMVTLLTNKEIKGINNYYFRYKYVSEVIDNNLDKKLTIFLKFIYNDDITIYEDILLSKDDLVLFVKLLESKGLILNNNQVNNLLNNFSNRYFKNNLDINKLKNKVIAEYSRYYEEHFYFKVDDFIDYYNTKYNDDFSLLSFSCNFQKLNRNIFDSIFYKENINSVLIVLEEDLFGFSSFGDMILDYKINCLEEDKIYYQRYKFYLKYLGKLEEFYNIHKDITIDYFILFNISLEDRSLFYELFKFYYKDNYKTIGRNARSIKNSANKLKEKFISELKMTSDKTKLLEEYKIYCQILKSPEYINEDILNNLINGINIQKTSNRKRKVKKK